MRKLLLDMRKDFLIMSNFYLVEIISELNSLAIVTSKEILKMSNYMLILSIFFSKWESGICSAHFKIMKAERIMETTETKTVFSTWLRHFSVNVSSFRIQKSSHSFNVSFDVSLVAFKTFLSSCFNVNFACFMKSCSYFLKCDQACIIFR